jgi:heat shock protein HtpX
MFKRISLLSLISILIIATFTICLRLFGLDLYVINAGLNYSGLLVFSIVWGMGGAFLSLSISKWTAKTFMGVQLVSLQGPHAKLVQTVYRLSRRAGLTTMPEVGIYQSNHLNAFATGPSKSNSLIAVSSGLVLRMNEDELEGVLAHEVSHIANGDMVTMTLIQGVLNAFVIFISRVIASIIDREQKKNNKNAQGLSHLAYFFIVIILEILFGLLASIIVNWFSRKREFTADRGACDLASRQKMIQALECLDKNYPELESEKFDHNKSSFKAFQISSKNQFNFLFSTHPPLNERIAALNKLN